MAQKKTWLTWLPPATEGLPPGPVVQALGQSGLLVEGAPWTNPPGEFAWSQLQELLCGADGPDVWVVAGRRADLQDLDTRFALGMIRASCDADRGGAPTTVLLGLDGAPASDDVPTQLRAAKLVDANAPSWAAKVVVASAAAPAAPADPFRVRAIAQKMLGLWIELGPRPGGEPWQGAMLGVAGNATIHNHAVGPRGGLPQRTVLEYALEGIQLEAGGHEFTANAVQNQLGPDDSYYVKVDGVPDALLIGPHPDHAEEFTILRS